MKQKPPAVWLSILGISLLVVAIIRFALVHLTGGGVFPLVGLSFLSLVISNIMFYASETKQTRQQFKLNLILNWVALVIIILAAITTALIILLILRILSDM